MPKLRFQAAFGGYHKRDTRRRRARPDTAALPAPHQKQIVEIYSNFNRAIKEFGYKGKFHAVYPLKVNQFPGFVRNLVDIGEPYGYGLEAGSKPELLLAMAYNNYGAPITVNGFKDKELIK